MVIRVKITIKSRIILAAVSGHHPMHSSLKTTNITIQDSAQDIRIVAWVLLVDLVLAAIGHTMVHTVLRQEVKDQQNIIEMDLV